MTNSKRSMLCIIWVAVVLIMVMSAVAVSPGGCTQQSTNQGNQDSDGAQRPSSPEDARTPSREGGASTDITKMSEEGFAKYVKRMEVLSKAQYAGQGEMSIAAAKIGAEASIKAASIQAGASLAGSIGSALIGAFAQLAGQKNKEGNQGGSQGTEIKAPQTGATADLSQMPPGAVAEATPRCVGLVAPNDAQIRTCTALGYVLNGNVLVPANNVTFSNNNPPGGPNLLVAAGSSPGTIEQLQNVPPGGVVETTLGPALGGNSITAAAISAPIRFKDVLTEGVVIGDFLTNTIARYPAAATGDRPPLLTFFNSASVWGDMPALWPQYRMQGRPIATFNYQSGGASDNPPPQTINIGKVGPNLVKIVPNIDDARIDLKGTHYNQIPTIIKNGIFYGSAEAAELLAVEGRTIQNYLLQSPTGGASYVVTGPYVRMQDGGKIIESSLRVGPDTLSPVQCEMVYGRKC